MWPRCSIIRKRAPSRGPSAAGRARPRSPGARNVSFPGRGRHAKRPGSAFGSGEHRRLNKKRRARARRLSFARGAEALPELVVQADPHDVHVDAPVRIVEGCRDAGKEEARRAVHMTEVLIEIFALDGPVRGEGVFDAATDCPASLRAAATTADAAADDRLRRRQSDNPCGWYNGA